MPKDRIPTSRIARTARLARLAAGQGTRQLGTQAANLARDDKGKQIALERRHIEAAEQIVTALGTMKGAAMKLGQVLSFLDVGLVPEEYRDEFQRKLGELRDAAPKVRFADMRKVIESELDEPLEEAFAAFERLRKDRVEQVVEAARRTSGGKAPKNALTRAIRDLVLPFFIRIGVESARKVHSYRVEWDEEVEPAGTAARG